MNGPRIVIGFDGSPYAQRALRWGFTEAQRLHGEIELVYAWRWPEYLPAAAMIPGTPVWPDLSANKKIQEMLTAAGEQARADFPDVPCRAAVVHGPPALVLRERSACAGLLVVGGRSHGAMTGFLVGSVAGALTAHADCTVVVVRDPETPAVDAPIVLGLDDSAHADRVAAFAFEQAAAQAAPLRIVRAWMPPPDPWFGSQFTDREEIAVAECCAVREQLAGWRKKYPTVAVRTATVIGHPYRVIAEAAGEARMVVLGARGGGGFPGLRLGSVTRHVLHHVTATVAVVR